MAVSSAARLDEGALVFGATDDAAASDPVPASDDARTSDPASVSDDAGNSEPDGAAAELVDSSPEPVAIAVVATPLVVSVAAPHAGATNSKATRARYFLIGAVWHSKLSKVQLSLSERDFQFWLVGALGTQLVDVFPAETSLKKYFFGVLTKCGSHYPRLGWCGA